MPPRAPAAGAARQRRTPVGSGSQWSLLQHLLRVLPQQAPQLLRAAADWAAAKGVEMCSAGDMPQPPNPQASAPGVPGGGKVKAHRRRGSRGKGKGQPAGPQPQPPAPVQPLPQDQPGDMDVDESGAGAVEPSAAAGSPAKQASQRTLLGLWKADQAGGGVLAAAASPSSRMAGAMRTVKVSVAAKPFVPAPGLAAGFLLPQPQRRKPPPAGFPRVPSSKRAASRGASGAPSAAGSVDGDPA